MKWSQRSGACATGGEERREGGHGRAGGPKGFGRERGMCVCVGDCVLDLSMCVGVSMGLRGGRESKSLPPL